MPTCCNEGQLARLLSDDDAGGHGVCFGKCSSPARGLLELGCACLSETGIKALRRPRGPVSSRLNFLSRITRL